MNRSPKTTSATGPCSSSSSERKGRLLHWRESVRDDPRLFRNLLRLEVDRRSCFGLLIQPWQAEVFAALDNAWRRVAGVESSRGDVETVCRRAWIERPRGHAKTSDMAIQITWALIAARRPVRGICAAADREQGELIIAAIRRLVAANPGLRGMLRIGTNWVEARRESDRGKVRMEVISSDVGSSFGVTPDFIICDELSHWPDEGLWHSLLSSAAKRPHCLLVVLTNAGAGRGWQWHAREAARRHRDWYFSTLDGPQAPWLSDADLAEQRAMLPASVFDRLWNNRWQETRGNFLSIEEVAACRDAALRPHERPLAGTRYLAAIDYAEKHDRTAALLLHREGRRLIIDRLDVVAPQPGTPVLVSWVEEWIQRIGSRFPRTTFIIDEHQLLDVFQRLGRRHRIVRFPFAGGKGNHELAMILRHFIVHRRIAWSPGCGALADDPADDLEREIADLVLQQSPTGRIRFDAPAGGHDDRAFVLAMAAWLATTGSQDAAQWQCGRASLLGW